MSVLEYISDPCLQFVNVVRFAVLEHEQKGLKCQLINTVFNIKYVSTVPQLIDSSRKNDYILAHVQIKNYQKSLSFTQDRVLFIDFRFFIVVLTLATLVNISFDSNSCSLNRGRIRENQRG